MKNIPPIVLDKLQALHKDFICRGKRPKIKHSTLTGSYEKGGFKDIDLTSKFKSLKVIWIPELLDETNFHPWEEVVKVILGDLGGEKIFHTNLSSEQSNKAIYNKFPKFYRELSDLWQSLFKVEFNELEFVLTQNLWNNAFLLPGNNPSFNRSLVFECVNYISDLFDCDGNFTSWNSMVTKFNLNVTDFLLGLELYNIYLPTGSVLSEGISPCRQYNMTKYNVFIMVFLLITSFLNLLKLNSK